MEWWLGNERETEIEAIIRDQVHSATLNLTSNRNKTSNNSISLAQDDHPQRNSISTSGPIVISVEELPNEILKDEDDLITAAYPRHDMSWVLPLLHGGICNCRIPSSAVEHSGSSASTFMGQASAVPIASPLGPTTIYAFDLDEHLFRRA
ncbi:hypothetical protein BDZ45DRAFT_696031 [Acephala macrosclerotiorum]|nr:hypothetical protein BDZ45DRAFT_696031 [Acephala macrosclerotiorum]